jgi:hypothetical protein
MQGRRFGQNCSLEDAIEFHAFALEALKPDLKAEIALLKAAAALTMNSATPRNGLKADLKAEIALLKAAAAAGGANG